MIARLIKSECVVTVREDCIIREIIDLYIPENNAFIKADRGREREK